MTNQSIFFKGLPFSLKRLGNSKKRRSESDELFFQPRFKWGLNIAITTANYILTYNLLKINWTHVYFYLSDIFLSFLAIEFYALCITFLDARVPWTAGHWKRLLVQIFAITPVVWLFCFLTGFGLESLIYSGRMGPSYYTLDLILIGVFIVLVQFIYTTVHFIEAGRKEKVKSTPTNQRLSVKFGTTLKMINNSNVAAAYVDSNITYIVDSTFKRYISDEPLKELDVKLSDRFFRANRQFIITRKLVTGYKSMSFGKVHVELINENTTLPKYIIVSRTKASSFRKWIKGVAESSRETSA